MSPETLSPPSLETSYEQLALLQSQADTLYAKLRQMPKDNLTLEEMRKTIDLMLELKKRLSPEETILLAGETAKKMPEFVSEEDSASETFRNEMTHNIKESKGFFASMKDMFVNVGKAMVKIITTLLDIAKQHPQMMVSVLAMIFGSSVANQATGFFNSLLAGGTENNALVGGLLSLAGIDKKDQETFMTKGLKGFLWEKAKEKTWEAATGPTATAAAASASAKIAGDLGAKAITSAPAIAESSTALRILGGLGGRLLGVAGFLMPKEMGNGEIPADQIRAATPEEQAKTMQYINSLPKAK